MGILNTISNLINPDNKTKNGSLRVTFQDDKGNNTSPRQDFRAKLIVPELYITQFAHGPVNGFNGILFPYTPNITYSVSADYGSVSIMHSNYPINFYKSSKLSSINVTAKFTVQNDDDAIYYLSTMHLLRALTKMRYNGEYMAGSPPPVCRFSAYGDFMLKNIPVVVSDFRTELQDQVDYYLISDNFKQQALSQQLGFGTNFIPTMSSITLTLIPMYSRAEQNEFTVFDYIENINGMKSNRGFM